MNIKNTAKAAAFISITVVLIFLANQILARYSRGDEDKLMLSGVAATNIVYEKKDSLDVVFLGDSLMLDSISPYEMYGRYGFTSYNCGTTGQYLYESYDLLAEVFQNQSPKVVVIEANCLYRFSANEQYAVIKLGEKFQIVDNHDNWKRIFNSNQDEADKNVENIVNDTALKGYSFFDIPDGVKVGEEKKLPGGRMTSVNISILEDIKKLCDENDAKLLLVSVPSIANYSEKKHIEIDTIAKHLEIPYLDYNEGKLMDEISIDWMSDTRDKGDHLCYSGTVKLTKNFGPYLVNEYGLPDHRNDINFEEWDTGLESYIARTGCEIQ